MGRAQRWMDGRKIEWNFFSMCRLKLNYFGDKQREEEKLSKSVRIESQINKRKTSVTKFLPHDKKNTSSRFNLMQRAERRWIRNIWRNISYAFSLNPSSRDKHFIWRWHTTFVVFSPSKRLRQHVWELFNSAAIFCGGRKVS